MSTPVHQIIYTSTPQEGLTHAERDDILRVARRNNARDGLTGILVHGGDQFMQVLEGPRPAIERLVRVLQEDPRHEDMHIVLAHDVAQRDFGPWDMARLARPRGGLPGTSALSQFFSPSFDLSALPYGTAASFLLQAFRELRTAATASD